MKAKINLPVRGKKNRFNFQSTHETTMSFGCFLPAYVKDLVPNESISVDTRFFARLAPMIVPTFGDIRVNMKSFFVPFSYCWDYWNDFITGNPTARPQINSSYVRFQHVPQFSWQSLIACFLQPYFSSGVDDPDDDAYDFVHVVEQQDEYVFYKRKFTTTGKHVFQMLQALGYNFSFKPIGGDLESEQMVFNALPLIAYIGMFYDNFIPQQYKVIDRFRNFKQYLHELMPDASTGRVMIDSTHLDSLLRVFVLAYKQDYFTSLWQEPNAVRSTGNPQISQFYDDVVGTGGVRDHSQSERQVNASSDGFVESQTNAEAVTPWQLRLAEKIQGWLTRNNLVGSDYVNRILANFGVKPVETLGVPKYCGQFTQQVKIDSIFDTAGVGDAPLGTYAGRGIVPSQGVGKFEVSVKEHGMFFVVATLEPMVEFTDGVDRLCLYNDRFDFYTPDFDGINMQAVGVGELFNTVYDASAVLPDNVAYPFNTLGFAPRYSERKWAKSRVTGDFNVKHLAKEVSPYSLQRNLLNDKFSNAPVLNSGQNELTLSGITFQYDVAQFNRIFAQTDGSADPLFALFQFDVKLVSPMLPLGESFEQFNSESNSIKMEENGAYSN